MISMRVILVVSAGVVLHLAMALGFMACRSSAGREHNDQVNSWQKQWEAEDGEREDAHREELEKEYGASPMEMLAYDPRIDIKTALKKLFQAAMPETYVVEVEVERFTEFTVLINVFNMPDKYRLAEYLQAVFSRLDPAPVYQVVFFTRAEKQYVVVDRTQLMAVKDWKGMTKEQIAQVCF